MLVYYKNQSTRLIFFLDVQPGISTFRGVPDAIAMNWVPFRRLATELLERYFHFHIFNFNLIFELNYHEIFVLSKVL